MKKIAFLTACLFWVTTLAQCGSDKSLSRKVIFKPVPNDPVVINADQVLFPGQINEFTVRKPWFQMGAKIENKSNNTVFVVTVRFTGQGVKNGVPVTYTGALNPGSSCTDTAVTRAYVAVLSPGQTYTKLDNPCLPTTAEAPNPPNNYEQWYIDALPEADSSRYQIEAIGEGWFVDDDGMPIERLIMSGVISTQ